jgi:hypothetical protein
MWSAGAKSLGRTRGNASRFMSHAYALDSYVSIDLGRTVRSRAGAAVANSTALARRMGPSAAACDRRQGASVGSCGMKFALVSPAY